MTDTAYPPSGDPAMVRAAAALEDAYPDWAVTATRTRGRFVAHHRHEDYDAHREQWGMIVTTVFADTYEQMRDRLDTQQALRSGEASPATGFYQHIGGSEGEVIPPGTVATDYARTWRIRCFWWSGGEWWTAQRHTPAPDQAYGYGVRNTFAPDHRRGPGTYSCETHVRAWLQRQAEAWRRWEDQHTG